MHLQTLERSPRHHRGGQVSYLLLTKKQFNSQNLTVTWVEGGPGSEQEMHAHDNEQAYVIVHGRGLMRVGEEESEVGPGTLVFIPPNALHAIRNTGGGPLLYVSATAPPFDIDPSGAALGYEPPPG